MSAGYRDHRSGVLVGRGQVSWPLSVVWLLSVSRVRCPVSVSVGTSDVALRQPLTAPLTPTSLPHCHVVLLAVGAHGLLRGLAHFGQSKEDIHDNS